MRPSGSRASHSVEAELVIGGDFQHAQVHQWIFVSGKSSVANSCQPCFAVWIASIARRFDFRFLVRTRPPRACAHHFPVADWCFTEVLRGERAVFPVGSHNARYDVALSLPSVVGREGVSEVIWPAMSADETEALERSAATLKNAVGNYLGKS